MATKKMIFSVKANDTHVDMKIKSIIQWLKQGKLVSIKLEGSEDQQKRMRALYQNIEQSVKSGAKVQHRQEQPKMIKFELRPIQDATFPIEVNQTFDANDNSRDDFQDTDIDELEDMLKKSIKEERRKPKTS